MYLLTLLVAFGTLSRTLAAQVIELDDSFIEKKGEKPWLVEFYAPWCGHCRRLEPVYHQVAMALRDSDIGVAKVDATMHSGLAAHFEVRGYPTIKFIQGDKSFTHRGDRSREGIIQFAKRCHGPAVKSISNTGKFHDSRSEHSDEVFFIYIGPEDDNDKLYAKYKELAEKYNVLSYFYAGERKVLPDGFKLEQEPPTVLVFRDGKHYEYQHSAYFEYDEMAEEESRHSLENFINRERFQAFPKVAGAGLNDMTSLDKKVVIMVVSDKTDSNNSRFERLKDMGKILATQHRDKYHRHFQFIWMGDPETAHGIMMARPDPPFLLVLEPDTQYYYLPSPGFDLDELSLDDLHLFLDDIVQGKSPAFGGMALGQRIKRVFYDIFITVYDELMSIYNESPWLALMIFGIPTVVISIVCYALCCMEPFDEEAFYEELAQEARTQQEVKEAEKQALLGKAGGEEG